MAVQPRKSRKNRGYGENGAIGGACCSQQLADEMGVDAFGESAVAAVDIFDNFKKELGIA